MVDRWQQHKTQWDQISQWFCISNDRYEDFQFLQYLDITDPFVSNYVDYQLNSATPIIIGRLESHYDFWKTLNAPENVLDVVKYGFKVPFSRKLPKIYLPNNHSS